MGRLDSGTRRLPEPAILVRPALQKEAQSTSAPEGTHTTLEETLTADFLEESNRTAEVNEVLNGTVTMLSRYNLSLFLEDRLFRWDSSLLGCLSFS